MSVLLTRHVHHVVMVRLHRRGVARKCKTAHSESFGGGHTLGDLIEGIHLQIANNLSHSGGRPEYLHLLDRGGISEPDFLSKRRRSEAGTTGDQPMERVGALAGADLHGDSRADRRTIAAYADEVEFEPVPTVPRIAE